MSTHVRAKTSRQLRHSGSRGKSHKLDKQQGELRKETSWLGVEAPQRPSPQRSFAGLEGHEYIFDGQKWHRCQGPEELGDHLEAEAARRSHYRAQTTRKGVPVEMLRRVETPVDVLTTSFPPWLSDWTAAEIASQRDPRLKLATVRNRWLESAQNLLVGVRYILGYALHADTDDLHFDLALSRQDGKGGRIGETGLGLFGPWGCGTDRQLRAGAQIHPDKRRQMTRAIANFRRRYGEDAVPLDVQLARSLDAAADEVLGAELKPYREAYAARVPELERAHAAAQLAALKAAETKLQERASAPEPERDAPEL
jgi:hypothetical protein